MPDGCVGRGMRVYMIRRVVLKHTRSFDATLCKALILHQYSILYYTLIMRHSLSSIKFQLLTLLKIKGQLVALLAGISLVFVIGAIWSFYWFSLAVFLEVKIMDWVDGKKDMPHIKISLAPLTRSNFPSTINLSSPALTIIDEKRESAWHTKDLRFSVEPAAPTVLEINLSGQHRFTFGLGESAKDLFVFTKDTTAYQPLIKNSGTVIQMGETSIHFPEIIGKLRFDSGKIHSNNRITINNINLPKRLKPPLGEKIQKLEILFSLISGLPKSLNKKGFLEWQKLGGALELERFFISYGPLRLSGKGKIALTNQLQPIGTFTMSVGGISDTIDTLANNGIVSPQDAPLIKIGLRMLAKESTNGDPEQVELPLIIQDGLINVGPFTLFQLPRFRWSK